ncbi:Ubiquitin carboxyl-terminal hydrolase 36 [Frankliniella fusca]|uniref:Ubiquitin carboxyl-terminal hydrolase 36 n=1 Tax=Frankliniella fusca TaxID=407009 RepID=A0AAE1H9Q4_9NEOP|nr:Ubiquitin carboxyl-terminal hydrolase 36 [Frankliniella fusca]
MLSLLHNLRIKGIIRFETDLQLGFFWYLKILNDMWNNREPPDSPQVVLYQEPLILGWQQGIPHHDVGLINLKNSCFLNATLQALFHVPPLVNFLKMDRMHRMSCDGSSKCVACALFNLLETMSTQSVAVPLRLYNIIPTICPGMKRGNQEDAHELLVKILQALDTELLNRHDKDWRTNLDYPSQLTTAVGKIFGGIETSTVSCPACKSERKTYTHCTSVSYVIKEACSLQSLLSKQQDKITFTCQTCNKSSANAKKVDQFHSYPKILLVLLKRFAQGGVKQRSPLTLTETITVDKARYRFIAGVIHSGPTIDCGHYTCVALCICKMSLWKINCVCTEGMKYGIDHEEDARKAYVQWKKETDPSIEVEIVGLGANTNYPGLGCSPDGIVTSSIEEHKLLEIKIPYARRNNDPKTFNNWPQKWKKSFCLYYNDSNELLLKRNHPYYDQVQVQMGVLEFSKCDLYVWTPMGSECVTVKFDPERWNELKTALQKFHWEVLIPEYFLMRAPRGLHPIALP